MTDDTETALAPALETPVEPPAAPVKTATKAGNATVPADPDGSWYGTLYGSVQTAGQ